MTLEEAWENLVKAAKREYGYRSPEAQKKLNDLGKSGELFKNQKFNNFIDKFLRKYRYEDEVIRDGLIDYLAACLDKFDSLVESVLLEHNIDPS